MNFNYILIILLVIIVAFNLTNNFGNWCLNKEFYDNKQLIKTAKNQLQSAKKLLGMN
mgnify:CR=1 FL=1|tara:strand:- start:4273 stop:4443 length:171 start_codon:yes stop_codon:yes gene_type:complete